MVVEVKDNKEEVNLKEEEPPVQDKEEEKQRNKQLLHR